MPLSPGTRLGTYEIHAQIGAGGMGEVYRATDTRLKRQVAIKILPPSFAADHDRLARFQREAEVLASLNHPHIAGIYGLEESDGLSALVMELVEGEDLSQRIARGAIPIDEALPIAKQITEALEAAHEQGIIHRDLKPANIKVRADGTVKVLDFGLAKALALEGASATADPMNSPTMTAHATQLGILIGTAAYMAPEQAKGRAVDKRADIWAFGVVVYEMLTGKGPFAAEDVSETLAAVLTRTVDLAALPAATPSRVRRLVARCLDRDPRMRLRDIGEARVEIEQAIAGVSDGATTTSPESRVTSRLSWSVAAVLALAFGVAVWAPWRSDKPVDRPLVRLNVDLGEDATFTSINAIFASDVAISPDGTRLAYAAGTPRKLFTRRLDQPNASQLPGTDGAFSPFFSVDGRWIGFAGSGKVNKISVEGGAVVPLEGIPSFAGATWAEDGSIVVCDLFGKGLLQLPAAGGAFKVVAPALSDDAIRSFPQLLPGGRALLLSACTRTQAVQGVDTCNIEALTLADGRRKMVARGGVSPHFVPSSNGIGYLVYVNKATLFAIPFDPASLETRGAAVPVLDDVGYGNGYVGLFDVSRTGTLIYRRARVDSAPMMTLQWIDSSGRRQPLRSKPAAYGNTNRFSPDGKRIALTLREGGNEDVWVYDLQRDTFTRLTFGGINALPLWSPDGQYIVFATIQGVSQARADGASPPHALTGSKTSQIPWSFTPDGKRLAYYETGPPSQIWTVAVEDEGGQLKAGQPEQFLKSTFQDSRPVFSPNGRWLAYVSNESGKDEVYVRPFPSPSSGQGGKWQVSNNGGAGPHWSGHEIVYRSGDQLMTVSYKVKGDAFITDKPRVWIAAFPGTAWDIAPDGKRLAVTIPDAAAKTPAPDHVIVMLQNFSDELRRRVPLGK